MATAAQIADLKEKAGAALGTLTDPEISALIDVQLSVDAAAAVLWERLAADTATLVDISESGSSRKMSDVHKNALFMVSYFRSQSGVDLSGRARTRAIVRD